MTRWPAHASHIDNSGRCSYLRAHLWVLSAFTLPQTFGSASFNPLTPETFAVIIAADTQWGILSHTLYENTAGFLCSILFCFQTKYFTVPLENVCELLTLEPGCSWRWEWHWGIFGSPPSPVLGLSAAGLHLQHATKTHTHSVSVIHASYVESSTC